MILLSKSKKRIVKLQQGGKITKQQGAQPDIPFVGINITTASPKFGDVSSSMPTFPNPIKHAVAHAITNPTQDKELKAAKGFISDRRYAIDHLNAIRNKMAENMASDPENYVASGRRAADLLEFREATNDLYNSGQLEKDFNKAVKQDKIDTGSYMIYDGNALVYDTQTRQIGFTPESNIYELNKDGKRRYEVQTVGNAITYRKNLPQFSGFTKGGRLLTGMLMHTLDTGEIFKRIDNTFKSGGFVAGKGFELITPDNTTADAADVVALLHNDNKAELLEKSNNTNAKAINAMRNLVFAQINSDSDFGSAMKTKAIQIATSTIPGFYKLDAKQRDIKINQTELNLIDNYAAKYLKTKYSEAFKTLAINAANEKQKMPSNSFMQAMVGKFPRGKMDFYGILQKRNYEIYPEMKNAPEGVALLHKKYNQEDKSEVTNISSLSKLSGNNNLSKAIITRGNVPLASITENGLHDAVVDTDSGINIIRAVPMEEKPDGTEMISEKTINLTQAVGLVKNHLVAGAWERIRKVDPKTYNKYEHNFANLSKLHSKGRRITEIISDKVESSDAAKALWNYVNNAGVKFKTMVSFNVIVKLRNGFFNFITSSEHPSAIPEEHQDYYTEVDDSQFESRASKTNKVSSEYNAYKTTVFMPLANEASLMDLGIQTRNLTAEQKHVLEQAKTRREYNEKPHSIMNLLTLTGK